ncbi:50S ribosomal protein L9, partial [Gammaproteobacteria bacterium]|nr:50S ribosomal protein L9 [Gammaproteobacteria bacterium]
LEEIKIKLAVPVSEEGTLYGSIGTREISDAIIEQGLEVEKSSVRLPEGALKEVGDYKIDIELHPEVVQTISITIEAILEE